MKRLVLLFVIVVLMVAALPAGADQTYSYWAWESKTDDDIYCFSYFPQIHWYYDYEQIGGKTIYCDGTESSWGATWCELDVRLEEATPCYYGSLRKPQSRRPAQFFFGVPPAKPLPLMMPSAASPAAFVPLQKKAGRCAKS